jgi:hypothetical protein
MSTSLIDLLPRGADWSTPRSFRRSVCPVCGGLPSSPAVTIHPACAILFDDSYARFVRSVPESDLFSSNDGERTRLRLPRQAIGYVYEHWSRSGEALYVGLTSDAGKRTREHERTSRWFDQTEFIAVHSYPAYEAARKAEAATIHDLRPRHNINRPTPPDVPTFRMSTMTFARESHGWVSI